MKETEIHSFCPSNQQDWRWWLELNHADQDSVWLIIYKKNSAKPNLTWSEAVDMALCFGWIDSVKRPIDEEKYKQYFGRRKKSSTWSKINKDKVDQLEKNGLMTEAGRKSIEIAKQNGSWSILDAAENLLIPDDLEKAFKNKQGAKDYFLGLSNSAKKVLLQWIVLAKRPETRKKRVDEIAYCAGQQQKPKQFR